MAHELDMTNGRANMFSVGQTPWHRLGIVLPEAPKTVEEALQISGTDWTVEKIPAHHEIRDGEFVAVPGHYFTRRTDTLKVLGAVKSFYTPLQNKDAFRVFDPLLQAGLVTFETMGSLRGGRDVWALVKYNVTDPVVQEHFGNGEIIPYGLATNNHAGERNVTMQETPVRVVCANTLAMALGDKSQRYHAIRHTSSVEAKLVEAATELWQDITERYRLIGEQFALLRRTYLDEALFRELVLDVALPIPVSKTETERSRKIIEGRIEKINAKRKEVTRLWTEGKGHTGDGSAWEAVNGLIEAVDHDPAIFADGRDGRLTSLMIGGLAEVKNDVTDSVYAYAKKASK